MNLRKPPSIPGLAFTCEEIAECRERNGLLAIDLELSRACNLHCPYCYADAGEAMDGELTPDEIQAVLKQSALLGARVVTIIGGGEPLLYPYLREIVTAVRSLGMTPVVFTNGTLIQEGWVEFFSAREVPLIVKLNTFDPDQQDLLTGKPGTAATIYHNLQLLKESRYPARAGLGIETVITPCNLTAIPEVWRYCRTHNIVPYVEMLTSQGRAGAGKMHVPLPAVRRLFEHLLHIDETEFGYTWVPHPPLAGSACRRHLYSLTLAADGNVYPCPGVPDSQGNIRDSNLEEILTGSALFRRLRTIGSCITGACRTCKLNGECYGCRGNAYHLTGDPTAADPFCWLARGED